MMKPRVAYVSRIASGAEGKVRAAHASFPEAALAASGASGASAFIGGGYYVLVFNPLGDNFQDEFARFTADPEVRRFFESLRPYLTEPLPIGVRPADAFHETMSTSSQGMTTSQLPLAGEVFSWEASH
jgi:hypothetical protein